MTAMRILAVGAAGKFAGLVVSVLAKRGALVRGMVRDAKQADSRSVPSSMSSRPRGPRITEPAIGRRP